jgi:HEAT repeat protein
MDQRPTNSIPIFIAGLRDRDAPERRTSANYLGHFGNAAAEAVPALTKLLEDPDPEARSAAQRALKKIDSTALDKYPGDGQ